MFLPPKYKKMVEKFTKLDFAPLHHISTSVRGKSDFEMGPKKALTVPCPLDLFTTNFAAILLSITGKMHYLTNSKRLESDKHRTANRRMTNLEEPPCDLEQIIHAEECYYYTDISLLWGNYTRMFIPRFPGMPEMLYFPTPKGIPGNRGTNILVYFQRSNEITVMIHFTRENAWKIDPKF